MCVYFICTFSTKIYINVILHYGRLYSSILHMRTYTVHCVHIYFMGVYFMCAFSYQNQLQDDIVQCLLYSGILHMCTNTVHCVHIYFMGVYFMWKFTAKTSHRGRNCNFSLKMFKTVPTIVHPHCVKN